MRLELLGAVRRAQERAAARAPAATPPRRTRSGTGTGARRAAARRASCRCARRPSQRAEPEHAGAVALGVLGVVVEVRIGDVQGRHSAIFDRCVQCFTCQKQRSKYRGFASASRRSARSTGSISCAPPGTVLGLLGPNGAGQDDRGPHPHHPAPARRRHGARGGLDVVKDAAALRAQIGLSGQYAAVDENLTGFENLEMVGRLYHLGRRPVARARARAARALRAHRRRRPAGQDLLGRHAPPARPGRRARRAGRRCCSSTSRRPGSTRAAACGMWEMIEALVAGGHHGAAHDAVPRRGRPAGRPHRGDRPRPRDRRGHARTSSRTASAASGSRSRSRTTARRPAAVEALAPLARRARRSASTGSS